MSQRLIKDVIMEKKIKKTVGKYALEIFFHSDGGLEVKVTGQTNDMRVISVLEIEKIRFINTMMSQAKTQVMHAPPPPGQKPPQA